MERRHARFRPWVLGVAAALVIALAKCSDRDTRPVTAGDVTPPSPVTTLSANPRSTSSILLTWTAPGDDGASGTASQYAIRVSNRSIADSTWDSAPQYAVEMPPKASGEPETLVVGGFSAGSTYFFGIKTADEVPNWSGLSNVASTATVEAPDTIAPAAVSDLEILFPSETRITLAWTAVGDDGCLGFASHYDVRFSESPLTEETWSDATVIPDSQVPDACGDAESLTVDIPSDTAQIWFALKAVDDRGQASPISNVVRIDFRLVIPDPRWRIDRIPILLLSPEYGRINAIEEFGGGFVIAGAFRSIDGIDMNNVAYWDKSNWLPIGSGIFLRQELDLPLSSIGSATVFQGGVVVGGVAYGYGPWGTYSSSPVLYLWDGTQWVWLGAPTTTYSRVRAVLASDAEIYYAGNYSIGQPPGDNQSFEYVACGIGPAREVLGEPNGGVTVIVAFEGAIVVGGEFTSIDGVPAQRVALWDGTSWSAIGGGMDGPVNALAADGSRLIAAGEFRTAGGRVAERIAEWDGSTWSPLGDGLGGSSDVSVRSLAFHNGEIIAAGRIPDWETRRIRNIARWDGMEWRGLGSGTNGYISDVLSRDGILYVVGNFDSAGGKPANRIATWEE